MPGSFDATRGGGGSCSGRAPGGSRERGRAVLGLVEVGDTCGCCAAATAPPKEPPATVAPPILQAKVGL